jgi:hypothetical protein
MSSLSVPLRYDLSVIILLDVFIIEKVCRTFVGVATINKALPEKAFDNVPVYIPVLVLAHTIAPIVFVPNTVATGAAVDAWFNKQL